MHLKWATQGEAFQLFTAYRPTTYMIAPQNQVTLTLIVRFNTNALAQVYATGQDSRRIECEEKCLKRRRLMRYNVTITISVCVYFCVFFHHLMCRKAEQRVFAEQ